MLGWPSDGALPMRPAPVHFRRHSSRERERLGPRKTDAVFPIRRDRNMQNAFVD